LKRFKRNIQIVGERVITKLKELIQSEHNQVEQDGSNSNNEEGDSEISNGENIKGEMYCKKVLINQLLHPHMHDLSVEGKIESISEPKRVSLRTGDTGQVADAVFSDQTGSISLSLWDNYSKTVMEGDHITIEKAYTKEYEGKIILSIAKSGKVVKCPDLPSEVLTIQERPSNMGAV
jgi:replication factor A1